MWTEVDNIKRKEQDFREAKNQLVMLKAAKELAKDNSLACMVEINGIQFGLCENSQIIPAIDYQIKEINKFLKGKPNTWE